MKKLLEQLETLRLAFELIKPSPTVIEGNKMSLKTLKKLLQNKVENRLSLRRREIFNTLKDHPYASFDFIRVNDQNALVIPC